MGVPTSIAERRVALLKRLFPDGVPVLWCPPVTHYHSRGAIDGPRIAAHLRYLAPYVKGLLVPGSTGDGWELDETETRRLLEIALNQAQQLDLHLLIGVLKTNVEEALEAIYDTVDWIESRTNDGDPISSLIKARVCGFTICPPRGKDLSQETIGIALTSVLQAGLPTAIYQLPQVTQNEIGPDLASSLALHFENFILLKDTSGADRIVRSRQPLAGVLTLRGAEGDYAHWLKAAGGPYDGFLLGSANAFARELIQIINDLSAQRSDSARQMSDRLTAVMSEVSKLVVGLPHGNAYANANKAIDHWLACGANAADVPSPWLRDGHQLPAQIIRATGQILAHYGLLSAKGYLE